MNIKLTKNIEEANCITHNGTFHCDEVFSTIMFSKLLPEVIVCRTSDLEKANSDQYIYDVGGGELDHHQFGGNGERDNGVKYSSCGLVWKKFGKEIIKKYTEKDIDEIWKMIDKNLIQCIDAGDNGQIPDINVDYRLVQVASIISEFNPNWDEDIDPDVKFEEAVKLAETVFDNSMKSSISKMRAKSKVDMAINDSKDGIMTLEKFLPWKEFLLESDSSKAKLINFVIFPSNRGGYNIYTVPEKLGSFTSRKLFPKEWAGLKDKELQKVTTVETARFCHNKCFICAVDTKDDALKLAKIANNL
ncbi:MAG: hypothetical protein BHW00_01880 [Clostridium sp. 26_22]|jgi:uncharacterized UPF0160 family protein|nr:MAG: hypothetical protein BHW00_01880 [Clostridium sp. 26_22]